MRQHRGGFFHADREGDSGRVGAADGLSGQRVHRDAAREATKACYEVGVLVSALLRDADQPNVGRSSLRSLRQDVAKKMKKQPPKPQPPKQKPVKGKSTYLGFLPDDDPIYDSGWRFVMDTYLNSHIKPKKEKGPR
jgi:hypothetical protein